MALTNLVNLLHTFIYEFLIPFVTQLPQAIYTFVYESLVPFFSKLAEAVIARSAMAFGMIFGVSAGIVDLSLDAVAFGFKNTLGLLLPTLPNFPMLQAMLPILSGTLTVGLIGLAGFGLWQAGKKLYPILQENVNKLKENYKKPLTSDREKFLVPAIAITALVNVVLLIIGEKPVITTLPLPLSFAYLAIIVSSLIYSISRIDSSFTAFKDSELQREDRKIKEPHLKNSVANEPNLDVNTPAPTVTPAYHANKETPTAHLPNIEFAVPLLRASV